MYCFASSGRWPDEHGIIGNYMYDRSTEDVFDLLNVTTTRWRKWWQNAEPIWITAEKQGHPVALYQWSRYCT
jgi:predicted AlkP superfamily pyrophosphatase or phosphodiesterase